MDILRVLLGSGWPSSAGRRLHSRRWECNVERLRRAFAKLSPDELSQLVELSQIWQGVHSILLSSGLSAGAAEELIARHGSERLLERVISFFQLTMTADAPRSEPFYPCEIIYEKASAI